MHGILSPASLPRALLLSATDYYVLPTPCLLLTYYLPTTCLLLAYYLSLTAHHLSLATCHLQATNEVAPQASQPISQVAQGSSNLYPKPNLNLHLNPNP